MAKNENETNTQLTSFSLLTRCHSIARFVERHLSSIVIRQVHELTATLDDGSPTIVRRGSRPAL